MAGDDGAHQRGVQGDGHGQPEADLLEHHHLAAGEPGEHGDHDQRRARDDAGGGQQPERHRLPRVAEAS